MQTSPLVDRPHRLIARAAAVIGLLGIALIHLLDLPGKLHETPYLGAAYMVLIVATLAAAGALLHRDDRLAWAGGAGLALLTMVGYAVNRTVGMPSATEDIGNWLEPLGLASLFVEAITAAVCIYALSPAGAPLATAPVVGAYGPWVA
jgi:hypothetical protein